VVNRLPCVSAALRGFRFNVAQAEEDYGTVIYSDKLKRAARALVAMTITTSSATDGLSETAGTPVSDRHQCCHESRPLRRPLLIRLAQNTLNTSCIRAGLAGQVMQGSR
jgi:hypothetical protein